MNHTNLPLWAKKQDTGGRYEWLPLYQHLEDTRQVVGLLWEHWLSAGQRRYISTQVSGGDDEKAKELAQFIGAVHDLGKATPAFQVKKGFANSEDLDGLLIGKLAFSGFQGIEELLLASASCSPHALAGQRLLKNFGVRDDIASIVGGHHGKPVSTKQTVENQASYGKNYYQTDDPSMPIHSLWETAQRSIFQWALQESGYSSADELPEIPQPVQVLITGLLIMADWIASNERYFPLIPIDLDKPSDSVERYTEGWKKWKKNDRWEAESNGSIEQLYEQRFGFKEPRDAQVVFSQTIESSENPGIFIFEAPMGLGKTEAAFIAVEQLAAKTGRSGMYFGLPTQATSNGIFPRVLKWTDSVNVDNGGKASIRLAHGKAALNEQFSSLARNINVDVENDRGVFVNEWFAGRKTSALDDFVVGTVDHFLLLALKQKHLALRHLGFSKKVVVIDEVHAYDAYMNQYLEKALKWMAAYGVPVVILSATLPADRRERMVKAYQLGRGMRSAAIKEQLLRLETAAYPLVTYTDGDAIKQETHFQSGDQKTIQIIRHDVDKLMDLLESRTDGEGVIGIIVNTVRRAQEIARECVMRFGEESVELLHSSYLAPHRREKEDRLIAMIGKDGSRPKKKIIIGTQVLEQSLDIDLDVLITDLAPMDLLIQRIGRLHRHENCRPVRFSSPIVYVLGTDENLEFDKGSVAVYGEYLLARTQAFLPEAIHIPDDISKLVQAVYSNDPVIYQDRMPEIYQKMKEEHAGLLTEKEAKAKAFRIDAPVLTMGKRKGNSLIGWLHNAASADTDEKAHAQVRDTQETIEVIALSRVGKGYGYFGTDEDISGRVSDVKTARIIAQQTLRLPNIVSYPRVIDQTIAALESFHADNFSSWHEQAWLKGALGIILDENHEFVLNGIRLKYDQKYGLTYERE